MLRLPFFLDQTAFVLKTLKTLNKRDLIHLNLKHT